LLQSAYDFLCLIYTKRSRASRKGPGQFQSTLEATRKKPFWALQWGFGDIILYTKTYSKTPKLNFCRLTIQKPIISVSNTKFEGGDDGHGHGEGSFLVK
jgi:hypothetical protein